MTTVPRRLPLILLLVAFCLGAAASEIALRAAADPARLEDPVALEGLEDPLFAQRAWRAYLAGEKPEVLLERVRDRLPTADDESTAALAELAGLIHQGRGEFGEAFAAFAVYLRSAPGRDENPLYLERLHLLAGEFPGGWTRLEGVCGELYADPRQSAELRARAGELLLETARRAGEARRASELADELGYLSDLLFLGPFDNENQAGFEAVYGPEVDGRVDPAARYQGKRSEVGWRGLPRPEFELAEGSLAPRYGPLRLSAISYPNSQVCGYLAGWLRVDERREVFVRLGAIGAYKLWIDGAEVAAADLYRSRCHPDTATVGVVLEPGWHEVLVKTCCDVGGWEVRLRLTDTAGEPLHLEHRARPPAGWRRGDAPEFSAPPADHYTRLEELAENGNPLALYYLGHLEVVQRRHDNDEHYPRDLFKQAVDGFAAAGANWAPALYEYGLYEIDFNLAREAYLSALEADPAHVESYIALCDLYDTLQRPDEVLDYAARGLEYNPVCLQLLLYRERQLAAKEYQLERTAVLDELLELHPDYVPALEDRAALYAGRAGVEERTAVYRRLLAGNAYDDGGLSGLYRLLVKIGRLDEACSLLADSRPLQPLELWPLRYRAEDLADHGRYAEAAGIYARALELRPDDAELLARRGACLWELERRDEALALWDRALEIQPNLTWVADYRRTLEQGPAVEQFDDPFAYDVYELIDAWEEQDPEAAAEYLLDQEVIKVNSDGTSSRVVHRVIKLKRPEALQDFGYGYFTYIPDEETYEVRHMRVIRGDGTELEATDFGEYSRSDVESRMYHDEYTRYAPLPGIEVGAVIDIEYRIDQVGENIYQGNFSDIFVFGNYEPTMLSEYIVLTPADYPLYSHLQNGAGVEILDGADAAADQRVIRRRAEKLPRIKNEPYAPPLAELLPLNVVSNFNSWSELGRWWWRLSAETLEPDAAVRGLAAELTADAETPFAKLTAIYDYVTSEIRYVAILLGIGGWKPLDNERCLNAGYGDCKATAALMISLLDAVGIEAYPVFVRTQGLGRLDWEQPAIGLFNHMICSVPFQDGIGPEQLRTRMSDELVAALDGRLFLDGIAEYHAWWELPQMDQGCEVYVCDEDGGYFAEIPLYPPEDNFLISRTRLELDETGTAVGHRELEYGANHSSQRRRDYQQPERQQTNLESYWNQRYPGAEISEINLSDMDDLSTNVEFAYDLRLPGLARVDDGALSFASHLHLDKLAQVYGSLSERRYPLRLDKRWRQTTTVEFLPPDGYNPAGLPDDVHLEITGDDGAIAAAFDCTYEFTDGVLRVTDRLVIDDPSFDPAAYQELRAFLAAYDRAQLQVLTVVED
ncbi:MAG: DUF3857 domain-containing protein [Candidatus Coatesbacteria bacterium]|nr:DUF3857 domain-containing protein [Candidatus Coatesbacteria bacterium]